MNLPDRDFASRYVMACRMHVITRRANIVHVDNYMFQTFSVT